jgi:hypothetical protein
MIPTEKQRETAMTKIDLNDVRELKIDELEYVAGGESVVEVARLAALAACLAGGGTLTSHATELK